MAELKFCPFCGGEASKRLFYRGKYRVHCNVCDAHSGDVCNTEAEAAEAWNTRTDDYRAAADYWKRMFEETVLERRTCEWTLEHSGTLYDKWRCSECGYLFVESRTDNGIKEDFDPNYCPNCGRKVVKE
jgi:Lar family restriction alleviation protein